MRFTRRLGFESLESRRLLAAIDIPDDLTGKLLEQVATPLNIDNAAGIRAAEIRITYDTTILNIGEADIVPGALWANDPTVDVVASVDDAAGTIVVSIFGANALPATSGSLVDFRFTIQAGATVGSSAIIDLTQVRINEGAITLDTAPQPGSDATDGRITVVADTNNPGDVAMVSGVVYADVNNNNQPDSTEGLP
ncbi:MAG: cohesin domain-containing protein, partial [Planctomycetota bacterium]